ncbi:MAG: Ni/Fe hydrogenase subunit alpha [Chloroflexi bacterium]|nr:Ni/Fe hydrogenase subunit alpha [Chloroflexota bacterium]
MTQTITIDPVTRIEGHSKITIQLGEDGSVADARFHVTQYRGFEKFIEGRPFYELPGIMGRICGICTISHELAAAQACEAIMSVRVEGTAADLRRIVNYASLLQSHALSFFYLSSPDFLLGMESDVAKRSIFGLLETHPEIVRDGVRLRSFGQKIIERMAGRRIHPTWIVAGGVSEPLDAGVRETILAELPEIKALVRRSLDWFKRAMADYHEEARVFANFPTLFMTLVDEREDVLELYRGRLRVVDSTRREILADFHRTEYQDYIGEAVEPDSYLKSPYYKPMGYPDGIYRVGPLARLNVIGKMGTPEADQELAEYRGLNHLSSFYFHYARLIECLHAVERIEDLLDKPSILNPRVRAHASANVSEGIGVTEAPRGTLIHHYEVDEQGVVTGGNLVVATTHNNLAMNRGVLQVARRYIDGENLSEGMLNRVEAVIRTFDPCLSCSTHASAQIPLRVQLLDPAGAVIEEALRG